MRLVILTLVAVSAGILLFLLSSASLRDWRASLGSLSFGSPPVSILSAPNISPPAPCNDTASAAGRNFTAAEAKALDLECNPPWLTERIQAALDRMPWAEWQAATTQKHYLPTEATSAMLDAVIPFLDVDLKGPSRIPPTTHAYSEPVTCANIPPELRGRASGRRREVPVRIFDLVIFAYELDVLEMRLFELEGAVDYFAVLESTHTHRGAPKPLTFARNEQRYRRWRQKILRFVGDYSDWGRVQPSKEGDFWTIEVQQRHLALKKLIAALPPDFIRPHDLILNGDLDEIPNGKLLRYIKECDVSVPLAFNTQFYVLHFGWTLRNPDNPFPSLSPFSMNVDKDGRPATLRGVDSRLSDPSGWHVTYFGGPIVGLYKLLGLAEGGVVPRGNWDLLRSFEAQVAEFVKGKRLCCDDRFEPLHPPLENLPWAVRAEPQRWRCMLPDREKYLSGGGG